MYHFKITIYLYLSPVASQDNPSGHDTYQVQYVDPEIYNANSQNQAQM